MSPKENEKKHKETGRLRGMKKRKERESQPEEERKREFASGEGLNRSSITSRTRVPKRS